MYYLIKLTHNIPLTPGDYQVLQRVLTVELGSAEDYQREYSDTPFGLLIRKIGKLDHDAAMEACSAFSLEGRSFCVRPLVYVSVNKGTDTKGPSLCFFLIQRATCITAVCGFTTRDKNCIMY